ncbi:lysine N(6)-hydroxylase/L-ornithine N(5)-oxygenase family protein [Streptomyces sp. HD]|uniref:lysine N(6)-hydroxylase/L-ornithine N(5)-oxygenase family protein n=1 Tax=Streptomyces sp. HD TaxID=3020892 RepID=UPI00232D9993|nr:SidA/IucD/PvdA family monooxygenase [Streptomyces sp. HD]MDC0773773.1 SidA/IucD/PvdA family monooxygenase [Streptomyces sp. HD]
MTGLRDTETGTVDFSSHFGCVGVGVGPANLSLACLLHDRPEVASLFFERRDSFGWHDDQQIAGATLQVSLFKDLVTLADPTNPFSFLSYLHEKGRIYHFINAQFDAVPRREFRDYLEWASRKNENVTFGEEVLSVEFDKVFVIRTSERTLTADHVSLGIGSTPWVPEHARDLLGESQFHVSDFLRRAERLGGRRVTVVGGGQSGAEAFLDLISRPAADRPAHVSWISRRDNFFPIDDSPFTNDYFMPSFSDHFFTLDPARREAFNERQVLATDGVSLATLRAIYQRCYTRRFMDGEQGLVALYPDRTVTKVSWGGDGWEITVEPGDRPHAVERLTADVIVWATGFRPARPGLLAPLAHRLEWEEEEIRVDQDFAACWDGPPDHSIFVQNGVRRQRGLADPNLSLIAWRSRRILDRILGVKTEDPCDSFLNWSTEPGVDEFPRGA